MAVWENQKDELNKLKTLCDIQNNLITNLLKMNQRLYDQLNNYKKENDKASNEDQESVKGFKDYLKNKYGFKE